MAHSDYNKQLKILSSIVSFIYDDIKEYYDKSECLGLLIKENGKYGFLCDKGNLFGLRYLGCEYEEVVPIRNHSAFPGGKAGVGYVLFKVRQNGKWGITSTSLFMHNVGNMGYIHIPCIYDAIIVIRSYPSTVIVRSENKCSFLFLNTAIKDKNTYETIIPVEDSSKEYSSGLYFACIKSWEEKTFVYKYRECPFSSPIIDITTNRIVGYDKFRTTLSKIEGYRWQERSLY